MKINRLILTLFVILLTSVPVSAGTVSWDNLSGGNWSTYGNWTLDIVPGKADDVTINCGSGYVTVTTDTIIKTLTVGGSNKLTMSTGKLTLGAGAQDTLYVSKSGNDGYAGTISAPKLTIGGAITAVTVGITKIYVAAGTYIENVTLNNGLSLYGGFSATDWNDREIIDRSVANPTHRTAIQGVSASYSGSGVTFSGTSTAEWILEGFAIESNHTGNSHGINVVIDGTATIRYNTISGGPGTNESNGIYVHGATSKMIVENNIINGGASGSSSNGIYIETEADQIITDNEINGGTGANISNGIVVAHSLASTSIIARNNIDGGSGSGGTSYGIRLVNYSAATSLNVLIHGNYIHAANSYRAYGISGSGSADGMSVVPGIFNNVIEASASGTGGRAYGIYLESVDGTPLVYNNTIAVSSVADHTYGIWTEAASADRATTADVQNNIIIGESSVDHDFALVETTNGLYSNIKNNDIYNCGVVISSVGTPWNDIAELNALRDPATSGNIDNNPVLSASPVRNLTGSSPSAVTTGGNNLSGVSLFPENSSSQKIDRAETARTAPWSIGAYERD